MNSKYLIPYAVQYRDDVEKTSRLKLVHDTAKNVIDSISESFYFRGDTDTLRFRVLPVRVDMKVDILREVLSVITSHFRQLGYTCESEEDPSDVFNFYVKIGFPRNSIHSTTQNNKPSLN